MAVKIGDFVEVDYTGKVKDTGGVFDTTDEVVAKENHLHNPKMKYGPVIICIGEGDLLKGLDTQLAGKELNKEITVNLKPEEAFGKKDAKLVQLIPTKKFTQSEIRPFPGLQVNVDGMMGLVKTVSGGRTLVDFNHPLSGREITYTATIKRVVTDVKEKVESVVELLTKKKPKETTIEDKTATIKTQEDLHPQLQMILKSKIKKTLNLDLEFSV